MLKRIVVAVVFTLLVFGASMLTFNIQQTKANGIVGDLNGDGVVNFEDLEIVAMAFGSYPGHPRWNPHADLNCDKIVDGTDMGIVAKHFGKKETAPEDMTVIVGIYPKTLNLRSQGRWITVYIELPEGYSPRDINISAIMLNETIAVEFGPTAVGVCDCDLIPDVMVKFERQKVIDLILRTYWFTGRFGVVTLTITGKLKDRTFQGSDEIRILLQTSRGI